MLDEVSNLALCLRDRIFAQQLMVGPDAVAEEVITHCDPLD